MTYVNTSKSGGEGYTACQQVCAAPREPRPGVPRSKGHAAQQDGAAAPPRQRPREPLNRVLASIVDGTTTLALPAPAAYNAGSHAIHGTQHPQGGRSGAA